MHIKHNMKHTEVNPSVNFVLSYIPGSGRITFNNQKSFLEAVRSGFIEIETPKFVKKVSYLRGKNLTWFSIIDKLTCNGGFSAFGGKIYHL